MLKKRWYDKTTKAPDAIELLRSLEPDALNLISSDIAGIANSLKTLRKEQEVIPLSIGIDRVMGLYKTSNSRRWYDKEMALSNAFKSISTLPEEDFKNIMDGICISLRQ